MLKRQSLLLELRSADLSEIDQLTSATSGREGYLPLTPCTSKTKALWNAAPVTRRQISEVARRRFRFKSFCPGQRQLIEAVLADRNAPLLYRAHEVTIRHVLSEITTQFALADVRA
jgi:hypothetical protein